MKQIARDYSNYSSPISSSWRAFYKEIFRIGDRFRRPAIARPIMLSIAARIAARLGLRYRESGAIIRGHVQLGRGVFVGRGSQIVAGKGDLIELGDHSYVLPGAMILSYGGNIRIGRN